MSGVHRVKVVALTALLALVLFTSAQFLMPGARQPLPTGAVIEDISFPCPVQSNEIRAGWLSSLYKQVNSGFLGEDHRGFDPTAPFGAPVRAIAPGHAQFKLGSSGGWGCSFLVEITHPGGWSSRYLHLNDFGDYSPITAANYQCPSTTQVIAEADVEAGDVIGHVGETGWWGSEHHLHFELRHTSRPSEMPIQNTVDPWKYTCQDAQCRAGWCDTDYYNPGAAISFDDWDEIALTLPLAEGEAAVPSIVPLAAKLEPNTYSFNPSFRVKLNYTLDEYETLFDFARNARGCQENHPNGVNPCLRGLMAAGAEGGITFKTGNCTHEMAMPDVGFGTYEVCALSPSAFPLAGAGMALGSYAVGYSFALVLEDRTAPPAVSGLRAELVSEPGEPDRYRISWNAPSAEDVESYSVVWPGGSSQTAQTSVEITMTAGTAGSVTVTPRDYAGHSGQSDSIPLP